MKKTVNENKDINQQDSLLVLQFGDKGCEVVVLATNNNEQSKLTDDEREELEECERHIKDGLATFQRVGFCLLQIRSQRLYREKYSTFEEYCLKVWKFSKTHANRLVFAAEITQEAAPYGVEIENEAQARCYTGLDAEERVEAYKDMKALAGKGAIQPKHHKQAADKRKAAKASSKSNVTVPEEKQEVVDNVIEVNPALSIPMPLLDILALVKSAHARAKKLKNSEELCSELFDIEIAIQAHVEQQQHAIAA